MQRELNDIYYWTYGDTKNPPILMIHGFTGTHEGFQYLVPALMKRFFIVIPDLAGFGKSKLFDAPWTIDRLAARMNEFVKSYQFSVPPIVVSHSMGGLVAASMLSQNPELFAPDTVFISPVATRVNWHDARKVGQLFGALHYGIGKRTGRAGERLVKSKRISRFATNMIMTTHDPALRETIHGHHYGNLEHIASIDYYHRLHKDINCRGVLDYAPTLSDFNIAIIAGSHDNVTPLKGEKHLAEALSAKLDVIPGVGHLAHYEKPDEITRRLLGFLE